MGFALLTIATALTERFSRLVLYNEHEYPLGVPTPPPGRADENIFARLFFQKSPIIVDTLRQGSNVAFPFPCPSFCASCLFF